MYVDGISFIPEPVSERDTYFGKEFFRSSYLASHDFYTDIAHIQLYNELLKRRFFTQRQFVNA
jgi:hypothetical protein